MELASLSTQQLVLLGLLITGIVELLNRLRAKDLWVVATILSAALVGGLVALYYDTDFVTGLTAGLSASGLLKTVGSIGNKSVPAPSKVLEQ